MSVRPMKKLNLQSFLKKTPREYFSLEISRDFPDGAQKALTRNSKLINSTS